MAANVSATFATAADTDPCRVPFTPIYAIQGAGATAALTGPVTTQGVVVGDFEGAGSNFIRGFYIQDPAGDGNRRHLGRHLRVQRQQRHRPAWAISCA